jgi:hypothetical protein
MIILTTKNRVINWFSLTDSNIALARRIVACGDRMGVTVGVRFIYSGK